MALDPKRLHDRTQRTLRRAATLAGVAFLIAAGLQAGASLKLVLKGQRFEGQAVQLGGSGPTFIRFARPDGQVTLFKPSGLAPRPGQGVAILVDPLRPETSPVIATPMSLWLPAGLMGVIGALLFTVGFNQMGRPRP